MKYNSNKVIFLALLEAAMRYREATWREDVDIYEGQIRESLPQRWEGFRIAYKSKFNKEPDGSVKRNWDRDMDRQTKNRVDVLRKEAEAFNKSAYAEIEKVTKTMSKEGQVSFDNYATGFGVLMEEFVAAKNTTHLLTICKLYNQGQFDDALAQLDKDVDEERSRMKTETETPISIPDKEKETNALINLEPQKNLD